jgi:predicted CXXCH cytochrome family protein
MIVKRKSAFLWSIFVATVFCAILLFSGQAETKVQGQCYFCHTMHNSQDGARMVQDNVGGAAGGDSECQGCHQEPRESLLMYTCIGCHALNASSGDGLATLAGYNVPQVYYADKDESKELASGNFIHIVDGFPFGWTFGHNVHGFNTILPDNVFGFLGDPPGYTEDMDPSTNKYNSFFNFAMFEQQVFCAGTFGCHGNRHEDSQTKAMHGTHHADDSILQLDGSSLNQASQGLSVGTSYRYLSGVKGGEDADWEYTKGDSDHNEYFGAVVSGRSGQTSQTEVETMSEFCASCHGNFHMSGTSGGTGISPDDQSPWIRHPTDVMIPNSAPYSSYTTYELTARVARTTLPLSASSDPQIGTNSVVFCLSCHKAHASRQPDMLRYSYSAMLTGGSSGSNKLCFACHGTF